ncbi:DNA repair protein [Halomicronema hongdechloris C2206]|uniref:DNA repair protein n=2 Tax=Halomicronema hongdechloris TaxID=1209493 RepID=A0A1Z3HMG0_9CYAN|nr:DNA repair protein [Halomicronema hongdechloris C2206]
MGFPVPGDAVEQTLDLNRHLARNPAATFFMTVDGKIQTDGEVQLGDVLVVDRSHHPKDGSLVVAVMAGEFHVLRIQHHRDTFIPAQMTWDPDSSISLQIWGVVTAIIRRV